MAQDRVCNSCGRALNKDSKFCPACGTSAIVPSDVDCPSCGEKNAPDSNYCDKCGTSLKEQNQESSKPPSQQSSETDENEWEPMNQGEPLYKVFLSDDFVDQFSYLIKPTNWMKDNFINVKNWMFVIWVATICVALVVLASIFWGKEETDDSSVGSIEPQFIPGLPAELQGSIPLQNQPVKIESVAPIIFSDEQASTFLLTPDDFPNKWTAKKNGMVLEAQNNFMTDFNVKMIKITLATQETEATAQAAFSAKKSEAQAIIDGRGISGDKLEDVKKYPLFVWNSGFEKWTVIGVYGNITVKVYHEGSVGAPNKGFAVDIAKKQIDRIKGD